MNNTTHRPPSCSVTRDFPPLTARGPSHTPLPLRAGALALCAAVLLLLITGCSGEPRSRTAALPITPSLNGYPCASRPLSPKSPDRTATMCILGVATVYSPGGGQQLEVWVDLNNEDPSRLAVSASDFAILESSNRSLEPSETDPGCLADATSSAYGTWQLLPGRSLTLPGQLCFDMTTKAVPLALLWHNGFIAIPLQARRAVLV
jgi:hypothetical protein